MAKETGKLALQLIGAGVLGSAFTLIGVTQFDLLETPTKPEDEAIEAADDVQGTKVSTTQPTERTPLNEMIQRVSPSVVGIVNYGQHPFQQEVIEQGVGSGVVYEVKEGATYIITNNHVIEQASKLEVMFGEESYEAQLVGTDVLTDLAVLKIEGKTDIEPLTFTTTTDLQIGDDVIAIGNPLGLHLSSTVTKGIISGLDRTVPVETSEGIWELNVLQTDAAINPGNSGGALLDMNGQVIGINTLKIANEKVEGLGFALPSEDVETIAHELMEKGEVQRPMLGVRVIDLSQYANPYAQLQGRPSVEGLLVESVEADSVAARGGIKRGDIIQKLGGEEIRSMYDLRRFLYTKVVQGKSIDAEVLRNEEKVTINLQF